MEFINEVTMQNHILAKDIIREYILENEQLKAEKEQLKADKESLIEERNDLIKQTQRLNYSGLGD